MTQHEKINRTIIEWYKHNGRDLPWRHTKHPYPIWVSEVMLQQTQVHTVIPYYHRFLKKFPTIRSLANASGQEILKVWENLGYYARARHLHEAAKKILTHHGGEMPGTLSDLLNLPGIGRYTAAAILCFAFGKRIPAVDGNVRRIVSRLHAIQSPSTQKGIEKHIHELTEALIPEKNPGDFMQALMDLGSKICTPQNPDCKHCPLNTSCMALREGLQEKIPVTKKRPPLPHKHVMAGLIVDQMGRFIIVRRFNQGLLGGLWKFPGGEKKQGETKKGALKRTIREEIGIQVAVHETVSSIKHAFTHFRITLHAFHCQRIRGTLRSLECADLAWVSLEDIHQYPFSKADRKIIEHL